MANVKMPTPGKMPSKSYEIVIRTTSLFYYFQIALKILKSLSSNKIDKYAFEIPN
jgi:hypothetical protein